MRARVRHLLRRLYVHFVRGLCGLYFLAFHGIRVRGLRNIPATGAVLLTPHHQSFYDGFMVAFPVGRPLYAMIEGSYLRIPVGGWILRALGGFPLDGPADRTAYRKMLELLGTGQGLVIFPEGQRSRDGELRVFQAGAARAALTTGTPVVPVSLLGAWECWPSGQRLPRWFRPLMVKYHRPIPVEPVDRPGLRPATEALTARIRGRLDRCQRAWRKLQKRRKYFRKR